MICDESFVDVDESSADVDESSVDDLSECISCFSSTLRFKFSVK